MTEDFGKPTMLRINRMALAVTWEFINKLSGRPLDDAEALRLKQMKELSVVISKSIELQMKLARKNKPKVTVVDRSAERALMDDYIARIISERMDGDRLNHPQ